MAEFMDKKRVWKVEIENHADASTVARDEFTIIGKSINSALSKASKYLKDQSMTNYHIVGITIIAVIDY